MNRYIYTCSILMLSILQHGISLSLTSSFASKARIKMRPYQKQLSRGFQRSRITMMPEGPEVKTLVDQLQGGVGKRLVNLQFVSGRYTTHGKPTGFEDFRNTMTNYMADPTENIDVVTSWNCKGKFIWLSLDQGKEKDGVDNADDDFYRSIWITLGMSGRFVRDTFNVDEDDGTTHKQPRWYFEFLDEGPTNPEKQTKKVYYYDTRNFGTLKFSLSKQELVDKLNSLGPDILEDEISPELFLELFRKPRQSMNLSKFLMDQKKIAGVGNYILAEVLFRAKLDPWASLEEISDIQARALYDEIIDVATSSYQKQGMTRRGGSYRDVDGNEGGYTFSLQCYGQEVSPDGEVIIRNTNGPHGRTIWYVESQLFMPLSERLSVANDKITTPKARKKKPSVEYEYVPRQDENVTLVDALECESWKNELSTFLGSEKFDRLSRFVQSERRFHTVYPLSQDVFTALNKCPFDKVKVVIIGQGKLCVILTPCMYIKSRTKTVPNHIA